MLTSPTHSDEHPRISVSWRWYDRHMTAGTVATPIVDKNGKKTTVHRNPEKQQVSSRSMPTLPPSSPVLDAPRVGWDEGFMSNRNPQILLEDYLTTLAFADGSDPDDWMLQPGESRIDLDAYITAARDLTEKYGLPRLGGTRAVWNTGETVIKMPFCDAGEDASHDEVRMSTRYLEGSPGHIPIARCWHKRDYEDVGLIEMEKVDVITWYSPDPQHAHLTESDYEWLRFVDTDQAGTTEDGTVVAFDLGEFQWDDFYEQEGLQGF